MLVSGFLDRMRPVSSYNNLPDWALFCTINQLSDFSARTAVLGHQRVSEGQSQRIAQCVSHGEQIANVVQGILCLRVVRLSFLRPHGS